MNTMAWIILSVVVLVIVFDVGFLAGGWWFVVGIKNKKLDELETEHHELSVTRHPFVDVCHRCGKRFDLTTSPDPALDVCPECWEALKENPDDEYFKKEMFE